MKTIAAVIGTPHGEASATRSLVVDFLDLVKENDPTLSTEIITLDDRAIAPCNGCFACTRSGSCTISDDLAAVQATLLKSDAVILGSPVYAESISAQTKTFIDRSFLWAYALSLLGKPALTAVTAAFSDPTPTEDYLSGILCAFGAIPVGHLNRHPYAPRVVTPAEETRVRYSGLATRLAGILAGRLPLEPSPDNQRCFETIKATLPHLPGGFAKRIWTERGWFTASFAEAVKAA